MVRGVLAIACAMPACDAAQAAKVNFRLGVDQLEGDFESVDDVKLTYIPLDVSFGSVSSTFTIRIPYVRINNSGNVVMTADGPAVLGVGGPGRAPFQTSDADESESGLGDIILREETFFLRTGRGKTPALSLVLDVKLPTADEEKGLGTGERDWGAGLNYVQPLSIHWRLLVNATRRFMKDPDGINLQDRWLTGLGLEAVTSNALYRFKLDSQTPLRDDVPIYDDAGAVIGTREVDDRLLARFDWIRQKRTGGSTLFGIWAGLSDHSENLGIALSWSTGAQ
jgi:hypothetical protein